MKSTGMLRRGRSRWSVLDAAFAVCKRKPVYDVTMTDIITETGSTVLCFDPLGMNSSTFEQIRTVTPYIKLSSVVTYAFMDFIIFLLLTRRKVKIFYASIPILTILVMILGYTIVSIPVTNDMVAKTPNCTYPLKSTSEDMALFCKEFMKQYYSGEGAVKDMFSAAVDIKLMVGGLALQ